MQSDTLKTNLNQSYLFSSRVDEAAVAESPFSYRDEEQASKKIVQDLTDKCKKLEAALEECEDKKRNHFIREYHQVKAVQQKAVDKARRDFSDK